MLTLSSDAPERAGARPPTLTLSTAGGTVHHSDHMNTLKTPAAALDAEHSGVG